MRLSLPLRFSIPVIIVLVTALIIPSCLFFVAPIIQKQHQSLLQNEAQNVTKRLKSTLTYLLERGDSTGVNREFRQNLKSDQVSKILVVDSSNQIRFSSHSEDLGKTVSRRVDVHLDLNTIIQVRDRQVLQHAYFEKENVLYSLIPIGIPAFGKPKQELEQGVMILALSDKEVNEAIRKQLTVLVTALSVAMLFLALILMFVINRLVTSRVQLLVSASRSFTQGQKTAFDDQAGNDELGTLGSAFSQMAKQISSIHAQLEANVDLLDELLENSPSMIVIRDVKGLYLRANPAYLRFAGLASAGALQGDASEKELPAEVIHASREGDTQVIQSKQHYSWELTYECEGQFKSLYSECFPLFDDDGRLYAVCTITTDMSDRAEKDKALRLAQYIFETTNDGIIVTDKYNRIVEANSAFERVTGYSKEEVIGQAPNILNSHKQPTSFYEAMWRELEEKGLWSGEIWNRKKDGQIYPEWLTVKAIKDEQDSVTGYFGVFTDISEQKKTEASLRNLAYYDSLTNLANRTFCKERLAHDMELSNRHKESLALVFIDLDFFKHVNDSLGHEYGDQLLVEAANRVKEKVRSSDTVVRWGGDEFILILPGIFQANMALVIANNVLEELKRPFRLKNSDVFIGASIGIAMYPHDADSAETLIQHADAAMYSAKNRGRDQVCFFDSELNRKNLQQIQMKSDIRAAIDAESFEIYYQAKVCLTSRKVMGLEALLRWTDFDGNSISPAEFIPVAENSGLILPLGNWVFATVFKQVDQWMKQGVLQEGERVSINLSPRQLVSPDLVAELSKQLDLYPLIEAYLSIEITETAVIENIDRVLPVLEAIRGKGVAIELDDFGSGYSSLNYLRRLPVDVLKVDKAFTAELGCNKSEKAIMATIISMAHTLGMKVVAEGVETDEQLAILTELKCDTAQGFYFSKPVPITEIEAILETGLCR
ncbi:EAL domain-containing protein [Neptuniibacter sp. SY11_33]|uniref:bifunctional diguanylate cyclase/phosphodiesterase n=1 Tax=Neptuniibacter sp. SY11_33 TaxID=3398215 RepID=UPI0039F5BBB8